ncbi:HDOD domain-containing protein [Sulfurivermis fontis]|uniref:HDOD domain-containing protein n=1 Tax=Sulfurivermis fontis TaxID=1972068 RepID=UPI000FD822E8|nr:HDOD domain-containing protein [Sulfurivermis fontis]
MHISHTVTETRLEIQKLNRLPPMSLVAQELLAVFAEGDMDVQRIAAIIEKDPPLLARLIGLANSAYFGYPERVATAEDAIFKVLGINIARSLAFSMVLAGPFRTSHCPSFHVDEYWASAMVTATLAQRLARLVEEEPRPHGGNAYLAGLLHNLGLLALVHLYPDEMAWVFDRLAQEPGLSLAAAETAALGADHLQVGGWLARKWHLPAFAVAAIEHHRDVAYNGEYQPLVRLIGFCAQWAARLQRENEAVDLGTLTALGIPPVEAESELGEMLAKRDEIALLARLLADG